MKAKEDYRTNSLTTWVTDIQRQEWDRQREKDGMKWSEWIQTKVNMALNMDVIQQNSGVKAHELEAEIQKLRHENESLKDRVREMESRIFGVMDDRITSVLSKER